MSTSREPFWRHPSGAQIIVAVIGVIGVVAGAVITTRTSNDSRQLEPQSSNTREATVTTGGRELELVSPDRITVRASSTLEPQQGNTYVAGNTIDGDPQTAWGEGKDGSGIGATITWSFDKRVDLRRVDVLNGYVKGNLFVKNLRIRAADVTTAAGSVSTTLQDIRSYQRLRLRPGPTNFLRLRIRAVYGSKAYNDALLSEIEFYEQLR